MIGFINIKNSAKRLISMQLAVILLMFVLIGFMDITAYAQPSVSASSAILIDAKTGEVLFAKNEKEKRSMASTTKIMTALLAIESGELEKEIVVTDQMVNVEGTSMGLMPQDRVILETLVYGMLLQSGNDAANAVALTLADSQKQFAQMMNDRAKEIGAVNTNFVTPSGLDDEQHYSTAYDMALIAREAMDNEKFAYIASQKTAKVSFGNPPIDKILTNHNRLLSMYEGTIGIKTGFTKKSGRCLVSCVERNGVKLIAVTLKAPDDWNDHMKMYDYGFSLYNEHEIDLSEIPKAVQIVGAYEKQAKVDFNNTSKFMLTDAQLSRIDIAVSMPRFIYAPIKKGQVIGYADIVLDNVTLERIYLTAAQDIAAYTKPESEKSFWEKLKQWIWGS